MQEEEDDSTGRDDRRDTGDYDSTAERKRLMLKEQQDAAKHREDEGGYQ